MKQTIGLFGTCSDSKWRDAFIKDYKQRDIDYFNPDLGEKWTPGAIPNENKHLNEDSIILFPVLSESLGFGSLGEIGFSILNVLRNIQNGNDQHLVVLIDEECDMKDATPEDIKLSNNTRKLVKSKLEEIKHPNVFVVKTLDEMKRLSFRLITLTASHDNLRKEFG